MSSIVSLIFKQVLKMLEDRGPLDTELHSLFFIRRGAGFIYTELSITEL